MTYHSKEKDLNKVARLHDLLGQLRNSYATDRFAFIKGEIVRDILIQFGATEADVDALETVSDRLTDDPTLAYRLTRNGRFCLDFENGTFRRMEFQPFVLTPEEDFIRHDSGVVRRFRGIQDDLQRNSAFIALMQFKAFMIDELSSAKRRALDYTTRNWISTVFHVRTITSDKILGEPAAEGAHCDGVDHTMTTFLGARNMGPGSGISQIHKMAQKTGTPWDAVDPALVKATVQHQSFLDTLLIFDNERKHTVSPVFCKDPQDRAQRDMLVIFTRKPATQGHPSHDLDSQTPHPDMPLDVPLAPYPLG
ncbi:2OG-Fe dioxygenase family protein [Aestuariivita sp.]|jgi:hypothetical protein|uniref:2OG-Fe dioxygenase family protein n=1 Tax=Aestuariivita sp. TaxID=1872407 RepID=UPI00216E66F4|nr:2OG-Fe dioxygenase family protein [Aestuariivita sp.]MCE8007534.1 2OG-Fe dioxygenase family protein [Aestuariivita sp.]